MPFVKGIHLSRKDIAYAVPGILVGLYLYFGLLTPMVWYERVLAAFLMGALAPTLAGLAYFIFDRFAGWLLNEGSKGDSVSFKTRGMLSVQLLLVVVYVWLQHSSEQRFRETLTCVEEHQPEGDPGGVAQLLTWCRNDGGRRDYDNSDD
jgi:hypothetical protein